MPVIAPYIRVCGVVLGVRGGRYAPPADLARLPPYVPAAFVAIEERLFLVSVFNWSRW